MKFQWSIQSCHTQLVLSQVVYLNYRNEHIWPPTRKWLHILEAFHLASLQFITFDHFESIHLILRLMPEIFFDISIWWTSLWLLGIIHFQYKSLSLFPSEILVCTTAFAAHYFFSFGDLHLVSSLSKNNKKCGKIYRHKSMHVSKPTWLLTNHSWQKLEDWFTTITHRCQDFSHKDISA